jgi:hypothetical protein
MFKIAGENRDRARERVAHRIDILRLLEFQICRAQCGFLAHCGMSEMCVIVSARRTAPDFARFAPRAAP